MPLLKLDHTSGTGQDRIGLDRLEWTGSGWNKSDRTGLFETDLIQPDQNHLIPILALFWTLVSALSQLPSSSTSRSVETASAQAEVDVVADTNSD